MAIDQQKPKDLFGLDREEDEESQNNDSDIEEQQEEEDNRFSKRRLRQAEDLFSKNNKDNESDQDDEDEDDESDSDSDNDDKEDESLSEEEEEEEESTSDKEKEGQSIDDHAVDKHGNAILDIDETNNDSGKGKKKKVKKLSPEELAEFEKQQKNTGVCYMSRIPMFMSPTRLREFLNKHAELGRIYLEKEGKILFISFLF